MGAVKQPANIQRDLYDRDLYEWANVTAEHLRKRDIGPLDWDHIAEEIEGLAGAQRRELYSRIEVLLMHLLKWQVQTEHRSASWSGTIYEQRSQLEILLNQSPSLKRLVQDAIRERHSRAVERAVWEMGLLQNPFPPECRFTPTQVLDHRYLPE